MIVRIELLVCVLLTLFQCKTDNEQFESKRLEELSIRSQFLHEAIIQYQNTHILNQQHIGEILLVTPIGFNPYPILEFNGIDHPISLGKPTIPYYSVTVQDMPVLIGSFYSGLLSNKVTGAKEMEETIDIYLSNASDPPNTGYSSDTWYVIIKEDTYQVINITDSIYHYNNEEKVSSLVNSILCPSF